MFKSITTNRLQLRPFTKGDAPNIQKLASNNEVAGILGLPQPYLLDHAIDWIDIHPALFENGTEYPLAVILKETDELVGTITLRVDNINQKGELGYWIGRPFWGRGYATEAVKRTMDFGIEDLGLNKIWASAMSKNIGSIAVLKKAGLRREGVLKEDRVLSGTFEDIDIYGIVKRDYKKLYNKE